MTPAATKGETSRDEAKNHSVHGTTAHRTFQSDAVVVMDVHGNTLLCRPSVSGLHDQINAHSQNKHVWETQYHCIASMPGMRMCNMCTVRLSRRPSMNRCLIQLLLLQQVFSKGVNQQQPTWLLIYSTICCGCKECAPCSRYCSACSLSACSSTCCCACCNACCCACSCSACSCACCCCACCCCACACYASCSALHRVSSECAAVAPNRPCCCCTICNTQDPTPA